ncbi:MAG: hypothetical protein QOH24_160 [Verrucomicrobiota bacterium]
MSDPLVYDGRHENKSLLQSALVAEPAASPSLRDASRGGSLKGLAAGADQTGAGLGHAN